MRTLALLGFVLVGLLAGGCSSVQRPTAAFTAMNLTGITADGFTMAFDVDLKNPNAVALPLGDTSYKLALGGVDVLEGKAKPEGALPANGNLAVKLPVVVTYENLLAAEKAIANGGGKVPYAFTGDMGVEVGNDSTLAKLLGQSPKVPLKYEGTLDVKSLLSDPQILMKSPAAKKLAGQFIGGWLSR